MLRFMVWAFSCAKSSLPRLFPLVSSAAAQSRVPSTILAIQSAFVKLSTFPARALATSVQPPPAVVMSQYRLRGCPPPMFKFIAPSAAAIPISSARILAMRQVKGSFSGRMVGAGVGFGVGARVGTRVGVAEGRGVGGGGRRPGRHVECQVVVAVRDADQVTSGTTGCNPSVARGVLAEVNLGVLLGAVVHEAAVGGVEREHPLAALVGPSVVDQASVTADPGARALEVEVVPASVGGVSSDVVGEAVVD